MLEESFARPTQAGDRDGWRRSARLFRSFLSEQSDPEFFYTAVADDAVQMMERHLAFPGKLIADFGGGPGYYSDAFRRAGATSIVVDADLDEVRLHGRDGHQAVVARAEQSPLRDESVDVAFSSNLLEHVPDVPAVADKIVRVVKPGGYAVLSYTIWYGPWGGHETSPWHYFGGHRAARRFERKHGAPPKNLYGTSMYAASVKEGLDWVRSRTDLELVEARPRYLPPRVAALLKVPVMRELLTWNLWLVLRKPSA